MTTNRPGRPLIAVGAVLQLEEPEYRYGVGRLTLRVIDVPEQDETLGEWMCIHGRRIDWRGVETDECRVYVSFDAIRRYLQRRAVSD